MNKENDTFQSGGAVALMMYAAEAQRASGSLCNVDVPGSASAVSSERYQRGLIALTNAAGVLSCAQGVEITLFNHGVGGDASGAGFPASSLFRACDTNVTEQSGLNGVEISAAGISFGHPVYITGSGDTFTTVESDDLAAYRDGLIRVVSENLSARMVRGTEDATRSLYLGNPSRHPDHRGAHDASIPNGGSTPGFPVLLGERVRIPYAAAGTRLFSLVLTMARPISIGARSTPATATVYLPVTVGLEVSPV